VDNQNILISLFAIVAASFSMVMLLSKQALTCALGLLGVLLCTAGIYGLIGEHFIAAVQLVVYAGAIMVLFIFSIMLLNLKHEVYSTNMKKPLFFVAMITGGLLFGVLSTVICDYFSQDIGGMQHGNFGREVIASLGGNSNVLSHALFSQYYMSFEVISLALIIGLIGAVTLAKRKFE
jgi:NADH-quinone oxidoreductase subunit J